MPNRLAQETSPYLLQHQHNPVDWRPWGPDALAEASDRDVPLLVSIGYSACHWCHVMERESFEDPETAAAMNSRFVCVKVDREERPDVDAIYMEAVQAMTGHGGWPLNAFLTPEGVPFFGGTYFPPDERHGMPPWRTVLDKVAEAWADRREEIRASVPRVLERLRGAATLAPAAEPADRALLDGAVKTLGGLYDRTNGGFGSAPKFPPSATLEFLLGRGEREMSLGTLRAMAHGGIHDQLGGGFARYAVDASWTVPHFEKMLYDNALLARSYLHGHLLSGDPALRTVCERTLDWALREMRAPDGGFYGALDADSEGEEGRFYVWTLNELKTVLGDGPEARSAIDHLGATADGNFEDQRNVLMAIGEPPAGFEEARAALLAARARRVAPGLDDKRICSWNALMLAALAEAGATLERKDYLDAAVATAEFLLGPMRAAPGHLLRSYNRGQARLDGVLEDHAYALEAMLTLYEASFDERWYLAACELADGILKRFADPERGGFFSTASDGEPLIVRRKELADAPIPSGQASATLGLLRLAALSGERRYTEHAEGALRLATRFAPAQPHAFGHWLSALDFRLSSVREVALVGDRAGVDALAHTVRRALRPGVVLAGRVIDDPGEGAGSSAVPLLVGREPVEGRAAAYVCERFSCSAPVTEPAELERAVGSGA